MAGSSEYLTGTDLDPLTVPGFEGRPAIAVLPFDNLSGDPDQEYFADGIAEDLLGCLALLAHSVPPSSAILPERTHIRLGSISGGKVTFLRKNFSVWRKSLSYATPQ
jgi:hypothetical protein